MRKLLSIVIILSLFLHCKESANSKEDSESVLLNLGLLAVRNNRLTVSGTALKGLVKNGTVTVSSLGSDGKCDTSNNLATGTTDESGNYSILYNKTGSVVCLTVSSNSNGKTTLYDEKANLDVAVAANSTFKLVTIIPESKIVDNTRKNAMVSPFSKLLARRLEYLIKQAGANPDLTKLHKKASKEIVIRFGLQSGLSTASGKAFVSPKSITASVTDSDYPELDDILLELEKPSSPLTAKFISILVGFSQLANKYKKGGTISIEDIDAMIEAFAADFEDGLFDGKGIDGKAIVLGLGANQITFSSTPLTSILFPAVVSYFQEGGKLSVGRPTAATPTITVAQITSQVQFVDNTPIVSADTTPTAPVPDLIANSLTTSAASYTAASVNDLVKVTAAEYATVQTNLSAVMMGYNGTIDNNWATAVSANETYAYQSSFVHANTVTIIPPSSYVVAFSFIPSLNPQNSFSCQLKYSRSSSLTNISNLYSGATIAVTDRQYFVIKKPSIQIPASTSSYLSLYSTSGIGTVSLVSHNYDYVAGNQVGAQAFSNGAAASTQYPTMQAFTTTTKNW